MSESRIKRPAVVLSLAAALAVSLGAAGCGGSSSVTTRTQVQTVTAQASAPAPTARFIANADLQEEIQAQENKQLANSTDTSRDHAGYASCGGPEGATATQEFWICSYEVSYPGGQEMRTIKATAYSDGSAIWGSGT